METGERLELLGEPFAEHVPVHRGDPDDERVRPDPGDSAAERLRVPGAVDLRVDTVRDEQRVGALVPERLSPRNGSSRPGFPRPHAGPSGRLRREGRAVYGRPVRQIYLRKYPRRAAFQQAEHVTEGQGQVGPEILVILDYRVVAGAVPGAGQNLEALPFETISPERIGRGAEDLVPEAGYTGNEEGRFLAVAAELFQRAFECQTIRTPHTTSLG